MVANRCGLKLDNYVGSKTGNMRCMCAEKELVPRGHAVSGFLHTRPWNDPISPESARVIPNLHSRSLLLSTVIHMSE